MHAHTDYTLHVSGYNGTAGDARTDALQEFRHTIVCRNLLLKTITISGVFTVLIAYWYLVVLLLLYY